MIWAYVLENFEKDNNRNNQPLFLLINDFEIEDDNLFCDASYERKELPLLLKAIGEGDRLLIRSVQDISDSLSDLLEVFKVLTEKHITLCSCEEPFLCGEEYLEYLTGYLKLYLYYHKMNQKRGYQKAVAEGKVGRPAKKKEITLAIAMYESGRYKMAQIEAMTGLSKSTIYRNLPNKREPASNGTVNPEFESLYSKP